MNIVLLGYMACGKSTIGKALAAELKRPFLDLDVYISERESMAISEIFEQKGEIYFRKIEHNLLKEVLDLNQNTILSIGGGTPCYGNNMDLISEKKNLSIYLKASIPTLANRLLIDKENRPLVAFLSDAQIPEFIAKHLFERRFFYEKAQKTLNIDGKTTVEIVKEIKNIL